MSCMGRSRMTVDPPIPTFPERITSGFEGGGGSVVHGLEWSLPLSLLQLFWSVLLSLIMGVVVIVVAVTSLTVNAVVTPTVHRRHP